MKVKALPRPANYCANHYNSVSNNYEVRYKPCVVHLFAQSADGPNDAYPVAVVEYEDGKVTTVSIENIKFTDR